MVSKRTICRCILVVWSITLISFVSFSQGSGSIRGRVLDASTGEPLIGANVIVVGTSIGAATDFDGNFYLRVVPAGRRII